MFYNVCPECGAALDPGEKCDCGKTVAVRRGNLTKKDMPTISCGCLSANKNGGFKKSLHYVDGTQIEKCKKDKKRQKNNTSTVTGVSYDGNQNRKKRWHARLRFKGVCVLNKYFYTFEEAVLARQQAECKYFDTMINEGRYL